MTLRILATSFDALKRIGRCMLCAAIGLVILTATGCSWGTAQGTLVETPYYTLSVPPDSLESGWTTSFDGTIQGDAPVGMVGHRLDVYTPSNGDEPYFSVFQCTENWMGLQGDEEVTTTVLISTFQHDGLIWSTFVQGGAYGDFGPMTQEDSREFTAYWAEHVTPR